MALSSTVMAVYTWISLEFPLIQLSLRLQEEHFYYGITPQQTATWQPTPELADVPELFYHAFTDSQQ